MKSLKTFAGNKVVEVREEFRDKTTWAGEDSRQLPVHRWTQREWRELNKLQFCSKGLEENKRSDKTPRSCPPTWHDKGVYGNRCMRSDTVGGQKNQYDCYTYLLTTPKSPSR